MNMTDLSYENCWVNKRESVKMAEIEMYVFDVFVFR